MYYRPWKLALLLLSHLNEFFHWKIFKFLAHCAAVAHFPGIPDLSSLQYYHLYLFLLIIPYYIFHVFRLYDWYSYQIDYMERTNIMFGFK